MHEARRALKDNGIRKLDIPRITVRLNANPKLNIWHAANDGAERDCCLHAEPIEVAEGHSECM